MTPDSPRRGDLVWLTMDPTAGHEQAGHRPHLVLSDERLATTMGLVIVVPLTTVPRPWATRVKVADGSYAIGEQPRTASVTRITRVERREYDTGPVVAVIEKLLGR